MNLLIWAVLIWLAVNGLAYLSFRLDKSLAVKGGRRIPENTLLSIALAGGSLGAKLAQRRFRHKTRKQPFAGVLNFICGLHILALIALAAWATGRLPTAFP